MVELSPDPTTTRPTSFTNATSCVLWKHVTVTLNLLMSLGKKDGTKMTAM